MDRSPTLLNAPWLVQKQSASVVELVVEAEEEGEKELEGLLQRMRVVGRHWQAVQLSLSKVEEEEPKTQDALVLQPVSVENWPLERLMVAIDTQCQEGFPVPWAQISWTELEAR